MDDAPTEPQPEFVGEGDMPAEFHRVNWGAYVFAPFWAASFKLWRVVAFYAVWVIGYIVVSNAILLWADTSTFEALDRLNNKYGFPVLALVSFAFAILANRYLWQTQSARFAASPEPANPIAMARLRKSNRFWFRFATVLVVLNVAAGVWVLSTEPGRLLDEPVGVVQTAALIGLYAYDLWLMRLSKLAS